MKFTFSDDKVILASTSFKELITMICEYLKWGYLIRTYLYINNTYSVSMGNADAKPLKKK